MLRENWQRYPERAIRPPSRLGQYLDQTFQAAHHIGLELSSLAYWKVIIGLSLFIEKGGDTSIR